MALRPREHLENRAVLGDEWAVLHEEEHARDRRFEHLAHRTVARVDDEGQLFAAADMRAANLMRRRRPALVAETEIISALVMMVDGWPGAVSLRMTPRLLRKRTMARSV